MHKTGADAPVRIEAEFYAAEGILSMLIIRKTGVAFSQDEASEVGDTWAWGRPTVLPTVAYTRSRRPLNEATPSL